MKKMEEHQVNISVNGDPQVPPGFRFHPTEEELLRYYLRKKMASEKIVLDVIREVDLNKLEPWDIKEKCKIGSGAQNEWYLFSHKDKKYPTGTRTNRATVAGFWKATGRDKAIHNSSKRILGMRKTLVFYTGRAPHGQKSNWIMHEYRLLELHDNSQDFTTVPGNVGAGETTNCEDGWVVCRVFKKKNYLKAVESSSQKSLELDDDSTNLASSRHHNNNLDGMERSNYCKHELDGTSNNNFHAADDPNTTQFKNLPEFQTPTPTMQENTSSYNNIINQYPLMDNMTIQGRNLGTELLEYGENMSDWAAFDRLLASQLDGPELYSPNTNIQEDFWSYGGFLTDPLYMPLTFQ